MSKKEKNRRRSSETCTPKILSLTQVGFCLVFIDRARAIYIYIYLNIISVYVCLYSNTIINNNNNNTHFLLRITVYESFGLWVMAVDADHHVSILI